MQANSNQVVLGLVLKSAVIDCETALNLLLTSKSAKFLLLQNLTNLDCIDVVHYVYNENIIETEGDENYVGHEDQYTVDDQISYAKSQIQ
eukprot:Pgem_evm1s17219